MALAFTQRYNDTAATASQSKTSSSFTPAANSLLVVAVSPQRENHSTAQSYSISDSVGLTWTQRGQTGNIAGAFGGDLIVWTAPVGASPVAMTVTVDPWATAATGWIGMEIFDVTGNDATTPMAQAATTNTTTSTGNSVSLTVTLGSNPTNGNGVVGIFAAQNDAAASFAAMTGFTALVNPTGINDHMGVFYRTDTTTAAVTNSDLGQSVNWGAGIALEIKASSSGTTATAENAPATATAQDATTAVRPGSEASAATAAGQDPAASVRPSAELAGATATAQDAAVVTGALAAGEAAGGTAAASDATTRVTVSAEVATAAAAAADASVSTAEDPGYETLFGGTPPTLGGSDDDSPLTVGVAFSVLAPGQIAGVRVHTATTETGTWAVQLHDNTGTLLADGDGPTNPGSGDYDVLFDAPVDVATATIYVVSVFHPEGRYSFTLTQFTADYTSPGGHLYTTDQGAYGPGRYAYGGSPAFPNNNTQHWYGAEPLFLAATAAATTVPAENAPAAAAAQDPAPALATGAEAATGSAIALDATVSTAAGTVASAECATATAAAQDAGVRVVAAAGVATATAAAHDAVGGELTDYDTFFVDSPPAFTGSDDDSPLTVGLAFSTLAAGSIAGVRFRTATTETGTVVAQIHDNTGTLLADADGPLDPVPGTYDVLFDAPVELDTAAIYVISVFHPEGRYSYTATYFTVDVTSPSGNLFAGIGGAYGPGRFAYGASPAFPDDNSQTWFGVEPLLLVAASPDVTAPAECAGGAAAAQDATAAASSSGTAPAEVATASAAALWDETGGTISLTLVAQAPVDATAAAHDATVSTAAATTASAECATGTAVAQDATGRVTTGAEAALAAAAAQDPAVVISGSSTVAPAAAEAAAAALDAVALVGTIALADVATATATAWDGTAAAAVHPDTATAAAAALEPGTRGPVRVGRSTSAVTARRRGAAAVTARRKSMSAVS